MLLIALTTVFKFFSFLFKFYSLLTYNVVMNLTFIVSCLILFFPFLVHTQLLFVVHSTFSLYRVLVILDYAHGSKIRTC